MLGRHLAAGGRASRGGVAASAVRCVDAAGDAGLRPARVFGAILAREWRFWWRDRGAGPAWCRS